MNKSFKIVFSGLIPVFIIGILAGIVGYLSAKITTFEECEKAGWIVRSIIVYDGNNPIEIEKECFLWLGKNFVKQRDRAADYERQLQNFKEDIRSRMPLSVPQSQEEIDEINRAGRLWFEENRTRLYENCAKFEIPSHSDDSGYDSIKKILTVFWRNGTLQQNMSIELPYEPETNFFGCSDSAKEILKNLQWMLESGALPR